MTRMEWEKARAADRQRATKPEPLGKMRRAAAKRHDALVAFAQKHALSCFACKATAGPWAKSGINTRGPWILCVGCVNKRQADLPAAPIAEA